MIKMPLDAALNASLDMLRLRGDVTDAVVILVNDKTGQAKVGSMRGDINHTVNILGRTLQSMQKTRTGAGLAQGGLIIPQ